MLVVGLEPDGLPACVHHVMLMHSSRRRQDMQVARKYPQKWGEKRDEKLLVANVGRSDGPVCVGHGVFCMDVLPVCQFANRTLTKPRRRDRLNERVALDELAQDPTAPCSAPNWVPTFAAIYSILSSGLLLNFSAAVSNRFQTSTNLCWPSSLVPIPFMAAFMTSPFRSFR
jgi:hypothetical protein